MPKAPMQEHEGDKGEELLKWSKILADVGNRIPNRDKPIGKEEPRKVLTLCGFKKKYHDINHNYGGIYNRVRPGLYCVPNRKHALSP